MKFSPILYTALYIKYQISTCTIAKSHFWPSVGVEESGGASVTSLYFRSSNIVILECRATLTVIATEVFGVLLAGVVGCGKTVYTRNNYFWDIRK